MSTPELKELGRRFAARRSEAAWSVDALASRLAIPAASISAFEIGEPILGASVLVRAAQALGVPEGSFLHVDAPEVRAYREPSFMLSQSAQAAMLTKADQRALTRMLHKARAFAEVGALLGSPCLAQRFKPMPAKAKKPHLAGYDLAQAVRRELEAMDGPLRDLRQILEDAFNIFVVEHAFDDLRVQAASCRSGEARLVAISPGVRREPARRIVLAHELAHHLADLHEEGAIADEDDFDDSRDRTNEEKRARAFAVMLLAPRQALAGMLGKPAQQVTTSNASSVISDCRQVFGVGFEAMTWHLFHLGFFNFHEDAVGAIAATGDGKDVTGFERAVSEDGLVRRLREARERDAISDERVRVFLRGASFAA